MPTEWDDDVDEFVDEDLWEDVELPDGSSVSLPAVNRGDFLDHVEVIAVASGGRASRYGPMIVERREYICCLDDVDFIRHEGDLGSDIDVVGEFGSRSVALEACIEQSSAFVAAWSGEPCNAWTDEDDVRDIDERDVWEPDDEDDEQDGGWLPPVAQDNATPPRGMSCLRRPGGRRFHLEPARERSASSEKREVWERLCGMTITHNGVVIAGEGASDVLPAEGVWHVIPCGETNAAHLDRVLHGCDRTVVTVDGRSFPAVFTDGLAPMTAVGVGAAFGVDEIWQLDRDTVCMISTDPAVIVAEGLRVR